MKVDYRQDRDPELMNLARARFSDEIRQLRAVGFTDFCCYTELLQNYSAITHLPIFILAKLNREIIRVESPLRLAMSQPILAHRERGAYALVFGMGIKFYTLFTDGTGLISANFPSQPIQDMMLKIYKTAEPRSIEDCWQVHNVEVAGFQKMGREVDNLIRFESYLSISRREETTA
ncbi:MAG: hypothetical protein L6Q49_03350 [Anaerolineales bacterium]|nr:hypothetical protein [Anaerolineales bacterium]